MTHRISLIVGTCLVAVIATFATILSRGNSGNKPAAYEPIWESLSKHNEQPEWMKDAKLGIYFHWGVYSVPAFQGEWYPRNIYLRDHPSARHHAETYGKDFQYHDFIPMFKAEKFDAKEWVELFHAAGAKFAGLVAEHHDGFSMWDSEITPWNSADMGPKRDILGELFKALEQHDMKTIATFHHARNLQRYRDSWREEVRSRRVFDNSHYPYYPEHHSLFNNPKYAMLYGTMPEQVWNETVWLGKLKEVIDNYRPDVIWFDSWLDQVPEIYRQRFAAYYLNAAEKWGREVMIVRKQDDLPLEMSIIDHEKSRAPKALESLWMTDDTYSTGSWCYVEGLELKPTIKIVHSLIDAVSKNGVLLLNISPMANGTIPDDQRKGLLELGAWLKVNGEAIYSTRPWVIAAEGPTTEPEGGFEDSSKFLQLEYSTKDIRYTASKDGKSVYAIIMGVPSDGEEIVMTAFEKSCGVMVASVETIAGEKVEWSQDQQALRVQIKEAEGEFAYLLKIKIG